MREGSKTEARPIPAPWSRPEAAHCRARWLGAALLAITPTAGEAQDDHRWKTYTNARYGFSVCYPADFLEAQPEPDMGDGRSFTGRNGSKLAAWASFNTLDWTASKAARMDEERLAGKSGVVSYKVVKANAYVLSGRSGQTIFYNRTVLAHGTFSTVELVYPAADSAIWDPIAARLSRCLKPG